jgi:hypothetical protein
MLGFDGMRGQMAYGEHLPRSFSAQNSEKAAVIVGPGLNYDI